MDFKSLAISATLAGSVLMTGAVFTGSLNLDDIKNKGLDWASKVTSSVDETKQMLDKFNVFKSDVTAQLNEKIAKINSLNSKIADLTSKVSSGAVDLESANNEIARLNEELDKANNEVQALKDQYDLTDADVQAAYASMATDSSMDTTLTLDTQNPDADTTAADATPTGTTTTDTTTTDTTATTTTTPVSPYASQETAIYNNIQASSTPVTGLTVDVTATTVTLTSNSTFAGANYYKPSIESALGKTVTYSSTWTDLATGINHISFTINQ